MTGWPAVVALSWFMAEAAPPAVVEPDQEFLEFLGSWTAGDVQHRWVDPFQLDDAGLLDADQDIQPVQRDSRKEARQKRRGEEPIPKEPSSSTDPPTKGLKP
jgi:hypothetical protein